MYEAWLFSLAHSCRVLIKMLFLVHQIRYILERCIYDATEKVILIWCITEKVIQDSPKFGTYMMIIALLRLQESATSFTETGIELAIFTVASLAPSHRTTWPKYDMKKKCWVTVWYIEGNWVAPWYSTCKREIVSSFPAHNILVREW